MDLGNYKDFLNELTTIKSPKYSVSKQRDDKGRLVVDGDIEAFLKDLHCIELSQAMTKLTGKTTCNNLKL